MSADLPRTVIVQWTNDQGEEEEVTTAVHGHGDFDLGQWGQAFKAQHVRLLSQAATADNLCVYIQLDLD